MQWEAWTDHSVFAHNVWLSMTYFLFLLSILFSSRIIHSFSASCLFSANQCTFMKIQLKKKKNTCKLIWQHYMQTHQRFVCHIRKHHLKKRRAVFQLLHPICEWSNHCVVWAPLCVARLSRVMKEWRLRSSRALYIHVHPTYICSLSDEPLLCVEDVFDTSDQLQRTAVIRALQDKEHMSCVRPC